MPTIVYNGDASDDVIQVFEPLQDFFNILNGGDGLDTIELYNGTVQELRYGPQDLSGRLNTTHLLIPPIATINSIERLRFASTLDETLSAIIFWGGIGQNQVGAGLSETAELQGGPGRDGLVLLGQTVSGIQFTFTVPEFTYDGAWSTATRPYLQSDRVYAIINGGGDVTLYGSAHVGIQHLSTSDGDDTIIGTDGMEFISGGGGKNVLLGMGGDDALALVNSIPNDGTGTALSETAYTGLRSIFDGGIGDTDFFVVGGNVNFQGTLINFEGLYLQPAYTNIAPNTSSQLPAVLNITGYTIQNELPGDLIIGGEGTVVVRLGAVYETGLPSEVDDSSAPVEIEPESGGDIMGISALPGGGYAIYWEADTDGDGDSDALAVQPYLADGSAVGTPAVLQTSTLLAENAEFVSGYELTALDTGGYVLAYQLSLPGYSKSVSTTPAAQSLNLTGLPSEVHITYAPDGTSYTLNGVDELGSPVVVPVFTDTNGVIKITQGLLNQFAIDNRLTIVVSNPDATNPANQVHAIISGAEDVRYDPSSTLAPNATIAAEVIGSVGVLYALEGRIEAFHVSDVTFDSSAPNQLYILNIATAQDAATFAGVPGAIVTPNGTVQFIFDKSVTDIVVPSEILALLGENDASISLFAVGIDPLQSFDGTGDVRASEARPKGLFVETFDGSGNGLLTNPVAIDDTAAPAEIKTGEDDDALGITALSGGGFAVHWEADTDGDRESDSLAVQQFLADGSAIDLPVPLALSTQLTSFGDQVADYELAALAGGGYALSYEMALPDFSRTATTTPANQNIPLLGLPYEIVINSAPGGTTFAIGGLIGGIEKTIPVSPDAFGVISVAPELLEQFDVPNRLRLAVTNPQAGNALQQVSAIVRVEENVRYDATAGLDPAAATLSGSAGTIGYLYTLEGRVEAFHDIVAPFTGTPATGSFFALNITTSIDAWSIDLSGVPGASVLPNGTIWISIFDTSLTDIAVPQPILEQLGEHDASITLFAFGIDASQSMSGTGDVRSGEIRPDGLFLETFDSAGVLNTGSAVAIDDSTAPAVAKYDDESDVLGVSPFPDGGFTVNWEADTDGDGEADAWAIQRFLADGSPDGSPTIHYPSSVFEAESEQLADYQITALDNSEYALAYLLGLPGYSKTVSTTTAAQALNLTGLPSEVVIVSAPVGTTYTLNGVDDLGNPVVVPVPPDGDGVISITQALLDQFSIDNRLSLVVNNPDAANPGNQVTAIIRGVEDVRYDPAGPLDTDAAITASTYGSVGVLYTLEGRIEAFHVSDVTFDGSAPNQFYILSINTAQDPAPFAGVAGGIVTPTGAIQFFLNKNLTDIAVPSEVLALLGDHDASISLFAVGIDPGQAFDGTGDVRASEARPAGPLVEIFEKTVVDTFDGSGFLFEQGSSVYFDIHGTDGNDTVIGTNGNDDIEGNEGDDTLNGKVGVNFVSGGPGEDVIVIDVLPYSGSTFDGGPDTDTLELHNVAGQPIRSGDLDPAGRPTTNHLLLPALGINLNSIEALDFQSTAGQTLSTLLNFGGLAPNQIGSGLSATAELIGGDGRDGLVLLAQTMAGSSYNFTAPSFTYHASWANAARAYHDADRVYVLIQGGGNITLNGSLHAGVQYLSTQGGNDTITGTSGMEFIISSGGVDMLYGMGGNDTLALINAIQNLDTNFDGVTDSQTPVTNFTGAGSTFDGGAGDEDFFAVGGNVNFQGTLVGIEGIYLMPAFINVDPNTSTQSTAVLTTSGTIWNTLPADLIIDGEGAIVINLATGESFDGSGYTLETASDILFDIRGTDLDDTFVGTSGRDVFEGGLGEDVVAYTGLHTDYVVATSGTDVQVTGVGSGTDFLVDVERLRFDDGDYSWNFDTEMLEFINDGVVADGYLSLALVCMDLNGNGKCDDGEPTTMTDEFGNFSFATNLVGPIIAIGGTNIDTGLPNLLTLSAPVGATVVNPVTTIVQALIESGSTKEDAEAKVIDAFNLDSSLDLSNYDPLDGTGDPAVALQTQKTAASLAELLTTIAEVSDDDETSQQAAETTLVTIINTAVDSSQDVDLTNTDTIKQVVSESLPEGTDPDLIDQLVEETQAANEVIQTSEDLGDISETQANNPPVATDDLSEVNEDESVSGNILDNDSTGDEDNPDATDALYVSKVAGIVVAELTQIHGIYGSLVISPDGSFSYSADADILDIWEPDAILKDHFTYKVKDGRGGIDEGLFTVEITVLDEGQFVDQSNGKGKGTFTGGAGDDVVLGTLQNDALNGGAGGDLLFGLAGEDDLKGGESIDYLSGGADDDVLFGGAGDDLLLGGEGDDEMRGGEGIDIFAYAAGHGADLISDFEVGLDFIYLDEGLSVSEVTEGKKSTVLTISNEVGNAVGSIELINVSGLVDAAEVVVQDLPKWATMLPLWAEAWPIA